MRYPTEGILNFLSGKRTLCHAFIASLYSLAMRDSVSKSALRARACKNSSFLSRAFLANSSIGKSFLDGMLAYKRGRGKGVK